MKDTYTLLVKFAYIQHPVKGKLLYDPYEYQLGLMHSYHTSVLTLT